MEDNNLNQNNQTGVDATYTTPVNQNTVVPNQTQQYTQFQQPMQPMNPNPQVQQAAPKKSGPLFIFGAVFIVAIVLVVTLFLENKDVSGEEYTGLITPKTKTLVVFFSKDGENYGKNLNMENKRVLTEGNTKVMAKRIAGIIEADLYEIEPVVPYPDDLNELYAATKIEYNKDSYPEIKTKVEDLDSYDVIFIGYPIWHAALPQIIKTFVRDNKNVLQNKVIVPFNTHAGSGSAGTYKKLFSLIGTPEEKGLNGLAINGTEVTTSDDKIKSWLKGIGYYVE